MIDTYTDDEGRSVRVDDAGKRHIRMKADGFHLELSKGGIDVECSVCGAEVRVSKPPTEAAKGWQARPGADADGLSLEWRCKVHPFDA